MTTKDALDCYVHTSLGLMPAVYVRHEGGLFVVRPVGSEHEYSFRPEAVFSVDEGERLLRTQRVKQVREHYRFEVVHDSPLILRCINPKRPRRSNYVLTRRGCTCPSKQEVCKHRQAAIELGLLE